MSGHGIISNTHFTEEGDMVRHDHQDVTDMLEDNLSERKSGDNDQRGKSSRKFASVPLIVLEHLKITQGIDYNLIGIDPDVTGKFFTWLAENPNFRTSEARLAHGNRYVL